MTIKNTNSEIRKDYLLNKYVIISPGRSKRPSDTIENRVVERKSPCPFCEPNIDNANIVDSIRNKNNWKVLSVKNLFPAISLNNRSAYGTQEVIIENPNHNLEMHSFNINQIVDVLQMYKKRTEAIEKIKNINYILCFKNQGSKAGASIIHSHSQIFASELLPPLIGEELSIATDYKRAHSSCAYCDIIKKESKSARKIWSDSNVLAFAPYASEYHYESWIFSKRHIDNISKANHGEIVSIAKAIKLILSKLKKLDLSFNLYMHQVIRDNDQHFYIKIQPRDSIWAGVEIGTGLIINTVSPEDAAAYFRK